MGRVSVQKGGSKTFNEISKSIWVLGNITVAFLTNIGVPVMSGHLSCSDTFPSVPSSRFTVRMHVQDMTCVHTAYQDFP